MRLTDFKALTFDCYGTLIDWESGIFTALQPLAAKTDGEVSRDAVLEVFARHESAQQRETPAMLYHELLATVHRRVAAEWGVATTPEEDARFGNSVPDWPAFADSATSLQYLKKYYKLVILSNVDRAGFAGSNKRLGVEFDAIYTAEDVGSYKPDDRNFAFMLEKLAALGIAKGDILHTAQSLFHDHVPAARAGLARCWIDRRQDQGGWGATMPPPTEVDVDFHFSSLANFVRAHQEALRG